MSRLDDIGERDGWRCWLCDEPVDPKMSVNDAAAQPYSRITKAKSKAWHRQHRSYGPRVQYQGAIAAVVAWPNHLFVGDPAPIITAVDRLQRKGGREIMARCPTRGDAQEAATWLSGRVARLAPDLGATADVEAGGGQFLLVLRAGA